MFLCVSFGFGPDLFWVVTSLIRINQIDAVHFNEFRDSKFLEHDVITTSKRLIRSILYLSPLTKSIRRTNTVAFYVAIPSGPTHRQGGLSRQQQQLQQKYLSNSSKMVRKKSGNRGVM